MKIPIWKQQNHAWSEFFLKPTSQSARKTTGIGAVSVLILLTLIAIIAVFSGLFSAKPDFDTVKYDRETVNFRVNERKAMEVFKVLESADVDYVKGEFEKGLVLWKNNKKIVHRLDSYAKLPKELHAQNQILLKYCDLRIQQSKLFIKSIREDTDQYLSEVNRIGLEIDGIIKELQKN